MANPQGAPWNGTQVGTDRQPLHRGCGGSERGAKVGGSTWANWEYRRRRLFWECWVGMVQEPAEDEGGTLGGFLSPQVRRNIVP